MDERAGQKDTARLAGRKRLDITLGKICHAEHFQYLHHALLRFRSHAIHLRNTKRAEKSARNDILRRKVNRDLILHRRRNDTEHFLSLLKSGAVIPAEEHRRVVAIERKILARDKTNERGLSRAIRTEQGDVLT